MVVSPGLEDGFGFALDDAVFEGVEVKGGPACLATRLFN